MTAHRRRTLFRSYFSIADRAPLMVRFAKELGARRVSLLNATTVFGRMIADTLEEQSRALGCGFEILRHEFEPETDDLRPQLSEVRAWGPDLLWNIGLPVPPGTCFIVIDQAAELGLLPRVPMMVGFPFPMNSSDYWRNAGEAGNGVMWVGTRYRPSWEGMTPIGRWLTERHLERYRSLPPEPTLNAFTDVCVIAQAAGGAGADTRDALIDALEAGEFDTWRGPVRFERGAEHWHHSPPEIALMQYQRVGQTIDDAVVIYPPESRTGEYAAP
jgi:branched-chain amino acid transport system substrate-binding protein